VKIPSQITTLEGPLVDPSIFDLIQPTLGNFQTTCTGIKPLKGLMLIQKKTSK